METSARRVIAFVLCVLLHASATESFSGVWGEWSDASECSRTCGGGVSHRTRKCHHGIPGLSSGCQGENIRYESCNTQPCPLGLETFRSVQCSRFNVQQVDINGNSTFYSWEPVEDKAHRCSLVCRAKETGVVRTLQERVVDGTECDSYDSHGICLGGVCTNVGCDRHIGSTVVEDKCRVCGGAGETCQTMNGLFDKQDLRPGENEVTVIPLGATTIFVREMANSSSRLVLKDGSGTVRFDGRQADGFVEFVAAGANFRFMRDTPDEFAVQSLTSLGPTNASLHVELVFDGYNPGVQFEYSIPKHRVLESNPNQRYAWMYGAWTGCSQECGTGYQLRAVSCIDRSSGASVADTKCNQTDKPATNQSCSTKPCGTADNWYRWVPGHWGPCSVDCGIGEQTQMVYCIETGASGDTVYVKDDLCERYAEKHPVYKRVCEGESDDCPYWATTAWEQCSVTCGYGLQKRRVFCQRDPSDPSEEPQVEDDSECSEEQPPVIMTCRLDPCPDGSNAHSMVEVEGADGDACENSTHGCCSDGVAAATGPDGQGCPEQASSLNACLLESDGGPCADYTIKWHFNPQDSKCRRFWYGGCKGNDNRFASEEECEAKCLKKEPNPESQSTVGCTSRAYGCCPDGVTPARGPNKEGCTDSTASSLCQRSRFGCCPDGVTAARGPNKEGCTDSTASSLCQRSRFGCCPDGVTAAEGPNLKGCEGDSGLTVDRGADGSGCKSSRYGCCPDGVSAAQGPSQQGCKTEVTVQRRCEQSYYGCCPNSSQAASGPNNQGCPGDTTTADFDPAVCGGESDRGTCSDYTVQWYYDKTGGVCLRFWYGGCGGNGNRFPTEEQCQLGCINVTGTALCRLPSVTGPCRASGRYYFFNHKIGKCEEFTYGGCSGNTNRFTTLAECENFCGQQGAAATDERSKGKEEKPAGKGFCLASTFGCCSDGFTAAKGPNNSGCPEACESSQYGCCEDGVTAAQGPNKEGCAEEGSGLGDCEASTYGCCPDGVTAAAGPQGKGCVRTTPKDDSIKVLATTPAPPKGENKCDGPSQRGPCTDYVVRWYFNATRQECAQFWYGGCQGNDNRFANREECEAECLATEAPSTEDPEDFVSICDMPRDPGPCNGRLTRWYYDSRDRQCRTFLYSDCGGNDNRFLSLQDCQQTCMGIVPTEAITTTTTAPYTVALPTTSSLAMTGSDRVREGQELRLTCRAEGPAVPTNIDWFVNGKRIGREHDNLSIRSFATPSEHSFTSELIIARSRQEDSATYYCRSAPYNNVERKTVIVSSEAATSQPPTRPSTSITTPATTTKPPSQLDPKAVCALPQESGRCTAFFRRWYYDAAFRTCRQFVYGGCGGNSNNFESERDCLKYCDQEAFTEVSRSKTDTAQPDDVCRLPAVTGRCRARLQRWYYDASLGECRQFVYGGCEGNSNNFESKAACNSYCQKNGSRTEPRTESSRPTSAVDVCRLPAVTGRCRAKLQRWYYDASLGGCRQFVYGGCEGNSNNFESETACNSYCQKDGSRTEPRTESSRPTSAVDVCRLPAVTGRCRAKLQRWYYDASLGGCRQFVYGGCEGNSNNFESETACNSYCRRDEASSSPRTDVGRTSSADPNEVCLIPREAGSCYALIPRWYYDALEGECRRFNYGGCQGNSNNFETEEACNSYCKSQDICQQPKIVGRCRAFSQRYYYDTSAKDCRLFSYGGCDGNLNNFISFDACQRKCRPRPGVGQTREVCSLDPDGGTCKGYIIAWYYDNSFQRCQRFIYTGCGGNGNRFNTEPECMDLCSAVRGEDTSKGGDASSTSQGDVCTLPSDRGPCSNYSVWWYYDSANKYCTRFYYGGCQGNRNRFSSKEECEQQCLTRAARPAVTRPTPAPATTIPTPRHNSCDYSRYGCCSDGITTATDQYGSNCLDDGKRVLVDRGSQAVLDCYNPGRAISWYRDGYYLTSDSRFHIHNNGTLVIRNVADDIVGSYACRITDGNTIPQVERYSVQLKASFPSYGSSVPLTILQSPPSLRVEPGENAYLHCQALGTPTPRVTWTHQGAQVYSGGRIIVFNNGTLGVTKATLQDSGVYECTAENGVDTAVSRRTQLTVQASLSADIRPHSGTVTEGETAQLFCDVKGFPSPSVHWEKDGVMVTDSSKMYVQGNALVITKVGIEDAGLYSCVATNPTGKARDITTVQVKLQSHRDHCTNSMSTMKCRLIVTARLCGHRMFARKCCQSCREAGLL